MWQDLSMGTNIFYLLTLTLKFDLLLKNFNLGNSFLIRIGRAFIFHMCIPCSKTFNAVPWFLKWWPWPWRLTYLIENWPGLWLLNQRGYLLLLFTYGCRRRAMLSFWQLWLKLPQWLRFTMRPFICTRDCIITLFVQTITADNHVPLIVLFYFDLSSDISAWIKAFWTGIIWN